MNVTPVLHHTITEMSHFDSQFYYTPTEHQELLSNSDADLTLIGRLMNIIKGMHGFHQRPVWYGPFQLPKNNRGLPTI